MSVKKLERSTDQKWVAGVCGGIADYTGADVNVVRLLVVVATLLGAGSLILVYVAAWIIVPAQVPPGRQTIAHEPPPPSV